MFISARTTFSSSDPGWEEYIRFVDLEPIPRLSKEFHLLGFDLCDETKTSSILNCGPWTGLLFPLTKKLNNYGLLPDINSALEA